jgi:predicted N-acetyltransferase YhbS
LPEIRTALKKDIPRIMELYDQLSMGGSEAEKQPAGSTEILEKALEAIEAMPGCELVVAEDGGTVIGSLMLTIVPSLGHGGLPWTIVENVIVESGLRGTGVGRLLMEYVREKSAQAGAYKIQLMSDKRRFEAHKFYHAIGYNATAEGFRMYL